MNFLRLLLPAMLAFTGTLKAQQVPSAEDVMKEACAKAAAESKQVLLIFHASWCGWCHKMDESLNDPSCKKSFDDNYVICHLTVEEPDDKKNLENPGAEELKKKYGGEKQGLPYWLIFDKDRKVLASSIIPASPGITGGNIGCPAQKEEVAYFIEVLKKTSRLTDEALDMISKRFSKNK